jgi:hypothetical protein
VGKAVVEMLVVAAAVVDEVGFVVDVELATVDADVIAGPTQSGF